MSLQKGKLWDLKELSIRQFVNDYTRATDQGMLSAANIKKLKATNILDALRAVHDTPIVYKKQVVSSNHRHFVVELYVGSQNIDPDATFYAKVLADWLTEDEVARIQILSNFGPDRNHKRERYIYQDKLALAKYLFIPIRNALVAGALEATGSDLKAEEVKDGGRVFKALNEIVVRVGAILNDTGKPPKTGLELYQAKGLEETDMLEGMYMDAAYKLVLDKSQSKNDKLRSDIEGMILRLRKAAKVYKTFLIKADKVAAKHKAKVADYLGGWKTTFGYVVFAAALDGRLNMSNIQKAVNRLPTQRNQTKVQNAVTDYTTSVAASEAAILAALGIERAKTDAN